ncbi:Paraquat-inducible protein A [Verrucomicrobiia bacterium DG1235]|nr:Paraquat-inducible protein A [Verrucomicrobiae bacterium DG1235]
MLANPDLPTTACPLCDLPVELPQLEEGEKAECPRCGAELAKRCKGGWHRVASFSVVALLALFVALGFSYLSLSSAGGDSTATVVGAAWGMAEDRPVLGALAGLFFLAIPAAQCVSMLGLSLAFLGGRPSLRWKSVVALIERLQPWCMADVFLLGTLVSLIKIASLAHVEFGISFWGFAVFVVFLVAAYSSLDTRQVISALHRYEDES